MKRDHIMRKVLEKQLVLFFFFLFLGAMTLFLRKSHYGLYSVSQSRSLCSSLALSYYSQANVENEYRTGLEQLLQLPKRGKETAFSFLLEKEIENILFSAKTSSLENKSEALSKLFERRNPAFLNDCYKYLTELETKCSDFECLRREMNSEQKLRIEQHVLFLKKREAFRTDQKYREEFINLLLARDFLKAQNIWKNYGPWKASEFRGFDPIEALIIVDDPEYLSLLGLGALLEAASLPSYLKFAVRNTALNSLKFLLTKKEELNGSLSIGLNSKALSDLYYLANDEERMIDILQNFEKSL